MTLQQLKTFCMVVEQKSFVRAAESLYMAQSSVSQQIAALEHYYGALFFNRIGKKCIVTPEGRVFYNLAKEILNLIDSAPNKIKEANSLTKGELRIGGSSTVSTYLLPPLLRQYKQKYPDIHLTVKAGYGHKMIDLLREGGLDLALVGHNLNWMHDPRLNSIPVAQDRLALIVWPGHEWCSREFIEPRELAGKYTFIHARPDSAMRSVVEKFIQQENLIMSEIIEMANQESIKLSVEQKLGISLISSVAIQEELKTGRLVKVPLKRLDSVARDFLLVSRADHELNALERAFFQLL